MNNKGFAITGILYTIFILFIMTLFSILAGLNTKITLLKKAIISFDNNYTIATTNKVNATDINTMKSSKTALYDGKYIFSSNCITYLKKGKLFNDANFTTDTCNNNKATIITNLQEAYQFKEAQ